MPANASACTGPTFLVTMRQVKSTSLNKTVNIPELRIDAPDREFSLQPSRPSFSAIDVYECLLGPSVEPRMLDRWLCSQTLHWRCLRVFGTSARVNSSLIGHARENRDFVRLIIATDEIEDMPATTSHAWEDDVPSRRSP